jgi:hypothetical protein
MIRGLVLCLSLIMIQSGSIMDGARHTQVSDNKPMVQRAESHPDLVAKFDEVAELKIASRKSVFHVGEMITLDVALLNTSTRPIFVRKLSELHVGVLNSVGQTQLVQEYGVADRALLPTSFVQLQSGEIIVRSFQLLAGCDKRAFAQFASTEDDDLTVFNKGLFLNWGDACLPTTQSEAYTVSVQLKNSFVLLSASTHKSRTAVGAIKSNSLEMTVTSN